MLPFQLQVSNPELMILTLLSTVPSQALSRKRSAPQLTDTRHHVITELDQSSRYADLSNL